MFPTSCPLGQAVALAISWINSRPTKGKVTASGRSSSAHPIAPARRAPAARNVRRVAGSPGAKCIDCPRSVPQRGSIAAPNIEVATTNDNFTRPPGLMFQLLQASITNEHEERPVQTEPATVKRGAPVELVRWRLSADGWTDDLWGKCGAEVRYTHAFQHAGTRSPSTI